LSTELTGRLAEYSRLADRIKAVRDGVDEIRATGCSEDGLVTAVVGGRGQLVELELDPRVYRDRDATALAGKIVAAVREAAAEAEQEAAALLGSEDPRFGPALHALEDRK
jgi:DNA-binding protein YbaB